MYHGEKFNTYSHLVALIIAIISCIILIVKTAIDENNNTLNIISICIYSATLILMYASSTLYHATYNPKLKKIFRYSDHFSIYLLIAGSYTPFTLIKFSKGWGWSIFGVIWGLAILGIIIESIKRIEILAMIIYVSMGWLAIIAIKPMITYLSGTQLLLLIIGGLLYTIGIYWYINDEKIKHGHGIWHIFVILGSLVQFICIYSLV